jgi:hypothetical protein
MMNSQQHAEDEKERRATFMFFPVKRMAGRIKFGIEAEVCALSGDRAQYMGQFTSEFTHYLIYYIFPHLFHSIHILDRNRKPIKA